MTDPAPTSSPTGDWQLNPRLNMPFTVMMVSATQLRVTVSPGAVSDSALSSKDSYEWLAGFTGDLLLDLSGLKVINSPMCSWIMNLARSLPPMRVTVAGANHRVRGILETLRLDALVTIRTEA